MSADNELLALAAKAAGLRFAINGDDLPGYIAVNSDDWRNGWCYWNPLLVDGDRYRLAKKLDIRLHFGPCYVTYAVNGNCRVIRWPEDEKDDAYAVVRAAAEIGSVR